MMLAISLLMGTLCTQAQDATTLADWNFETSDDIDATWFASGAPSIAPDACVGEASNYVLTGLSTGRYWQVCSGWQNKVLRIDCTKQETRTEPLNMEFAEKYVGSKGLAIRYMYEDMKPGIDPLGPENNLYLTTGPMTGTPIPCSGKLSVAAKSPATGTMNDCSIGGHAGIRPLGPGYTTIELRPTVPDGLNRVDCTYCSVSGTIESHWRRTGKGIEWTVEVPPNTTAEVYLPTADGCAEKQVLGSGRHHLSCRL